MSKFKAGDRVSFKRDNLHYTVTVEKIISETVFLGLNATYTKGKETTFGNKYIISEFDIVKPSARNLDGRFRSAKPKLPDGPFTEKCIESGAKYVNSRYPGDIYFGVSLGGELCMLHLDASYSGAFSKCTSGQGNPQFWAAFSKVK